MSLIVIAILAFIQGMAELLPVSSSAHVIVAEKLMGIDPTTPEMTFLLVMLHTGTMFAVLIYFWRRWAVSLGRAGVERRNFVLNLLLATGVTAVLGLTIKKIIEKVFLSDVPHAEIEILFGNLTLVSASLFTVGLLITFAETGKKAVVGLTRKNSAFIGAIQGLCLPFRGFSRSGATISVGLMSGVSRAQAEEFSFALAVVLTPPVVVRELLRLLKSAEVNANTISALLLPGMLGMVLSFGAGLLALKWLSSWIDNGRWRWFGYYCLVASVVVFALGRS